VSRRPLFAELRERIAMLPAQVHDTKYWGGGVDECSGMTTASGPADGRTQYLDRNDVLEIIDTLRSSQPGHAPEEQG